MTYTSQRIETFDGLRELKPEWDRLHSECTYSSIYNGATYTIAAAEALIEPPAKICFITVRERTADGPLVAIFPFQNSQRKRFNWSYRTIEYAALSEADKPYPIIARDHEDGAWRSLAEYLTNDAGRWDILDLSEVKQGLAANVLVPKYFRPPKYVVRTRDGSRSPIVPLDEGWEAFAAKHRRMRKKIRDIERAIPALRFVVHDSKTEWQEFFERFKALEQRSWKAGKIGISKNARAESFYRELFDRLVIEEKIQFASFLDGDEMISGSIAYSHGETAYFCHVTYDEAYAKYSPGMVMTSLFLKHLQETPLQNADFLGGFAQYLNPWAKEILTTKGITVIKITPKIVFDFLCFSVRSWSAKLAGWARNLGHSHGPAVRTVEMRQGGANQSSEH